MAVTIQYQFLGIGLSYFCNMFNINREHSSDVMYMYFICIHLKCHFYSLIFRNHSKCHHVDYNAKNVPITYRSLSFNMHVHYELLLCRNDLTTLTDMMKFRNVVDIVDVYRKIKFLITYLHSCSFKNGGRKYLFLEAEFTARCEIDRIY